MEWSPFMASEAGKDANMLEEIAPNLIFALACAKKAIVQKLALK